MLCLAAACGGGAPRLIGSPAPAGSILGEAGDSGIERFPRPSALVESSRDVGGNGFERRVFRAADGTAATTEELSEWYGAVLPRGQSQGEWSWCAESNEDGSETSVGEIRRYEHPDDGVLEVEIRDLEGAFVQLMAYRDGDCSVDPHDVRCANPSCDELVVDE
jgi:hypothetical protein